WAEMWEIYQTSMSPHLDFFLLKEKGKVEEKMLVYAADYWNNELKKRNIHGFSFDEMFPTSKKKFLGTTLAVPKNPKLYFLSWYQDENALYNVTIDNHSMLGKVRLKFNQIHQNQPIFMNYLFDYLKFVFHNKFEVPLWWKKNE